MKRIFTLAILYFVPGLILGFLLGWMATGRTGLIAERVASDFNHDNVPDAFFYYTNNILAKAEYDRNFDNTPDYFEWYLGGVVSRFEADDNFDGAIDGRGEYEFGRIATCSVDTDFNGLADAFMTYSNGVLAEINWRPNGSSNVLRRERFAHGVKVEAFVDSNEDGILDRRIVYDAFERVIEQDELPH